MALKQDDKLSVPFGQTRSCGECSVCCYVSKVEFKESAKPPHKRCLHVIDDRRKDKRPGSCGVFGQDCRPSECLTFVCSWLGGVGAEKDRPDKSGVMLSVNTLNGGTWVFVIETQPGALETTGKNIVLEMVHGVEMPAIVASYGKKPPDDTGDRVIVKDSLLPRCKFLIGAKLGELSDDVSIYELLDSRNT